MGAGASTGPRAPKPFPGAGTKLLEFQARPGLLSQAGSRAECPRFWRNSPSAGEGGSAGLAQSGRGPWPVALNSPPGPRSSGRDWNPTVTGCPVPSINSQAATPTPAPARGPPLRRPRRRPPPGRSGARPGPTTPCRTLLPSRSVGSPTASCLRSWRQAKELRLTRRRRLGVFGPAWRAEGAGATGVPGEARRGAQRDPPPQARELESRRAPGIWQRRARGKRPEERPHLAKGHALHDTHWPAARTPREATPPKRRV